MEGRMRGRVRKGLAGWRDSNNRLQHIVNSSPPFLCPRIRKSYVNPFSLLHVPASESRMKCYRHREKMRGKAGSSMILGSFIHSTNTPRARPCVHCWGETCSTGDGSWWILMTPPYCGALTKPPTCSEFPP